jgi:5,10-methylenetetrahydromethanopterin reductase
VVAEGPASLRQAGEIADGVVVGMGLTPEAIAGALEYMRQGAEASGRSLDDLDIWWQTRWNIEDDAEQAKVHARALVGTAANHAFRFTLEGKFLPQEFHDPVRQLMQAWEPTGHGGRGVGTPNERLVENLGLTDYLTERFAIVGTLERFISRVEALAVLGVRQIRLGASVGDRGNLLRILADQVIPQFP